MGATVKRKDLLRLLEFLDEHGCTIRESKGGWLILYPNGQGGTTLHMTHSDHRAMRNFRSQLRQAGITIPKGLLKR